MRKQSRRLECSYLNTVHFLTIVWDDGPSHGRCVDATNHPEHAEPGQMLSSLLLGEELRVIGKHNWDGATNAVELKRKVTELEKVASVPITKDSVICDFFYLSVND